MDPTRLQQICRALPVFPLPRSVLLPGEVLPLHVFEPRYRALVEYCLQSDRMLGVATLKPGFEPGYHGRPALHPEVGVGEVVAHQTLPDGRSNIVLRSIGRGLIRSEVPAAHPFRLVDAEMVDEPPHSRMEALDPLRNLLLQLGSVSEEASQEARRLVSLADGPLVDALARKLLVDPDRRRDYLRTVDVVSRAALVQPRLAAFLFDTEPIADA